MASKRLMIEVVESAASLPNDSTKPRRTSPLFGTSGSAIIDLRLIGCFGSQQAGWLDLVNDF
jgi:hypothetical protein